MNPQPLLVTCGLPYTNGPCHLGHLRTYVPADAYVRYMRRAGEEVVFVCGSDNHGTPIVVSAEDAGISPRALSERYHKHFDETFRRMGVIFDRFGMTRRPGHPSPHAGHCFRAREEWLYLQADRAPGLLHKMQALPSRPVRGGDLPPLREAVARGDECDQGCGKHLEPGRDKRPALQGLRHEGRIPGPGALLLQTLGVQGLPPAIPRDR